MMALDRYACESEPLHAEARQARLAALGRSATCPERPKGEVAETLKAAVC
jgi:hypothetical protein